MAAADRLGAPAAPIPGGGDVDHIVLGVSDVEIGVEFVADVTGVTAVAASVPPAPSSPTVSRSINLGGERFLEVYAPNPAYVGPDQPMRAVLSQLAAPRLLTWFTRVSSLDSAQRALEGAGFGVQRFMDEWDRSDAASFRNAHVVDQLFNPSVPFLIEWRDRLDMDSRMANGLELLSLTTTSADPALTRRIHTTIGIVVPTARMPGNSFGIVVDSPRGVVRL